MTTPEFSVGDRVLVMWMGEAVEGMIHTVETHGSDGHRLADPVYRVEIDRVSNHPFYDAWEVTRA